MTALGGEEVEATFSVVGVASEFLGSAAAEPQQAAGQDGADLTEVRWEVQIDGIRQGHGGPTRIVLPYSLPTGGARLPR